MKFNLLALLLILSFSLTSCINENEEENSSDVPKVENSENRNSNEDSDNPFAQLKNAIDEVEQQVNQTQGKDGEKVEPMHFKELQKATPEKIAGFTRTKKEGSTNSMMGIKISTSSTEYTDGDKKIDIEIVDTGGFGMALMSMAAWSNIEMEKETDNGWEKTTVFEGFKSFEKYNKSSNRSELSIIAHDRLIVNLEGKDVDMDDLKKVGRKVLKNLKPS